MSDLSPLHRLAQPRPVRSPRGPGLSCANWQIEAAFRMIQNNLDPEVAENPDALVVYGGIGKAARNWDCFEAILASLKKLKADETLLVQSGKPVGVFRTHADAPRVLIANSNLVPKWATWEHFDEFDRKGLMMFGQITRLVITSAARASSRAPRPSSRRAGSTTAAALPGAGFSPPASAAWAGRSRSPPPSPARSR